MRRQFSDILPQLLRQKIYICPLLDLGSDVISPEQVSTERPSPEGSTTTNSSSLSLVNLAQILFPKRRVFLEYRTTEEVQAKLYLCTFQFMCSWMEDGNLKCVAFLELNFFSPSSCLSYIVFIQT
jgi:hypothetical protein